MRRGVTTWISKSSSGWRADVDVVSVLSRMGKRVVNKREREREIRGAAGGGGEESDKFLSVIMDTSKASRVFNEDHPPMASHRR